MSQTYAEVELQDALLKITLYLGAMGPKSTPRRAEKAVALATETFLKFMDSEEFARDCYDRAKSGQYKHNYYALLFIDQMLKNSKFIVKNAKREVESIFKMVWESVRMEADNQHKLENLKLIARVWGFLLGERTEDNLRRWIEHSYKTKLTLTP